MSSKLIVALDFDNQSDALTCVDKLDPTRCSLKVGSELFTIFGSSFVKLLIARNFRVFLDLKFHDIPNTVSKACKAAADLGVWMINVHALGGANMMLAARKALESYGQNRPLLIAVTVLTSLTDRELSNIGINQQLNEEVKTLAKLASDAGLDGVVCSAHEVRFIKETCGLNFITVTPGIRLDSTSDDQARIMSPIEAIREGSDFLVVGRPITQSVNPDRVVNEILKQII